MSSVDERIVEMKFNNQDFEKNMAETSESIKKFNQELKLDGATQGLSEVQIAAEKLDLSRIADGVDNISSKFGILGVVGATAIGKLTSKAVDFASNAIGSIWEPLVGGGERRAQNIAQAEFMLEGLGVTGERLTKTMDAASYAVDKTAYGLDVAAMAASSFIASNVEIENLPSALRGISGVASMTSRSYEDISQIFTTVAGNGRLMASELNRIGASGLNAAAAIAKYLGVTETEVREMTSKGEIDFITFATAMDQAFGEQATKANDLYTGSLSNVRAALARIGQTPAEGKFERLRLIFNGLIPVINQVGKILKPFQEILKESAIAQGKWIGDLLAGIDLSDMIGMAEAVARGLRNIQTFFKSLIQPAKDAWNAIFPKKTKEQSKFLTNIGEGFEALTEKMVLSEGAAATLRGIFEWLFGALKTGIDAVKTAVEWIGQMVSAIREWAVENEVLQKTVEVFKTIGDTIKDLYEKVVDFVKGSEPLQEFFEKVKDVLKDFGPKALETISSTLTTLKGFFEDTDGVDNFAWRIDNLKQSLIDFPASVVAGIVGWFDNVDFGTVFDNIATAFKGLTDFLGPVASAVRDSIATIISGIGAELAKMDIAGLTNLAELAAKLYLIWNTVKMMQSGSGMMDSIGGFFGTLSEKIQNFRAEEASTKFLKIAAGIAILAGALWLISGIPADQLWNSIAVLGAIGLSVVALGQALDLLSKNMTETQAQVIQAIANVILSLAAAIAVLALAVLMLAKVDPDRLWGSIGAVSTLLIGLSGAMMLLGRAGGAAGMLKVGGALLSLSAAILMLALGIKIFSNFEWDTIVEGMIKMSAALLPLILAASAMGNARNSTAGAMTILALAGSMIVLAFAVKQFAGMKFEDMITGVGAISILLFAMSGALSLLSKNTSGTAAAAGSILMLAGSMWVIAEAIKSLAGVDNVTESVLALGTIAVLLGLAAGFLGSLGTNALKGAGAFAAAALSLYAIAGAMTMVAELPVDQISRATWALGGISVVLGALVGVLSQFGGKSLMGAGAFAIAAAGLIGIAFALQMVADVPATNIMAVALVVAVLAGAIALIVVVMEKFVTGALIFAAVIAVFALLAWTVSLLVNAITELTGAFESLISTAIDALERVGPALETASIGFDALMGVVKKLSWDDIAMLGGFALGMGALGLAAIPLGAGALLISTAFSMIGDSLVDFVNYGPEAARIIPEFLDAMTQVIDGPLDAMAFLGEMTTIGLAMIPLGVGLGLLADSLALADEIGSTVKMENLTRIHDALDLILPLLSDNFSNGFGGGLNWYSGIGVGAVAEGLKPMAEAFQMINETAAHVDEENITILGEAMGQILSMLDENFSNSWFDSGMTSMTGGGMSAVAEALVPLAEAFDQVNTIADNIQTDNITKLGTAMSSLLSVLRGEFQGGGFDATRGLNEGSGTAMSAVGEGLPKLAEAFAAVDEIQVNQGQIDLLGEAFQSLLSVLRGEFTGSGTTSWSGLTAESGSAMESVSQGLPKLADAFAQVDAIEINQGNIDKLGEAFDSLLTILQGEFSGGGWDPGLTTTSAEAIAAVGDAIPKLSAAFQGVNDLAAVIDLGAIQNLNTGLGELLGLLESNFTGSAWIDNGMDETTATAMTAVSEALTPMMDAFTRVNEVAGAINIASINMLNMGLGQLLGLLESNFTGSAWIDNGMDESTAEAIAAISPSLESLMQAFTKVNEVAGAVNIASIIMLNTGLDQLLALLDEHFKGGGIFATGLDEGQADNIVVIADSLVVLGGAIDTLSGVAATMAGVDFSTFTSELQSLFYVLKSDAAKSFDGNAIAEKLNAIAPAITTTVTAVGTMTGDEKTKLQGLVDGLKLIGDTLNEDLASTMQAGAEGFETAILRLSEAMVTAVDQVTQAAEDVSGAVDTVKTGMDNIVSAINTAISGLQFTLPLAGFTLMFLFAAGLASGQSLIVSTMTTLMAALVQAILNSRTTVQGSGLLLVSALVRGILSGRGLVRAAGVSVAASFIAGVNSGLSSASNTGWSGGFSIGMNIAAGAAAGVYAGRSMVVTAVSVMAQAAVAAAQAALKIKSPSRVFMGIGRFVAEGMALGTERGTSSVVAATENMANSVIDAASGSISQLNNALDLNVDMDPTIRPVLDLTDVETKAALLGRLLTVNPIQPVTTYDMALDHSRQLTQNDLDRAEAQAEESNGDTNVTYNQTINSPSPVSTVDVYRQTKNLLSKTTKKVEEPAS